MSRPDFVPYHKVIAVDLANHGDSPHTPRMDYQQLAEDVVHLIHALQIDAVCLIGHCMGGKVAMHLASAVAPQVVAALIVIDMEPVTYDASSDGGRAFLRTLHTVQAMRKVDLGRGDIERQLEAHGVRSPWARRFVMKANLCESDGVMRWRCNLTEIEKGFPGFLGFPKSDGVHFDGPTCILKGEQSWVVSEDALGVLRSLLPNYRLVVVQEAAHCIQEQAPEEFCSVIAEFLKDG